MSRIVEPETWDGVSQLGEDWVEVSAEQKRYLEDAMQSPHLQGALLHLTARLLSPGWTVRSRSGGGAAPAPELERELGSEWTSFIEALYRSFFVFGLAVLGFRTENSVADHPLPYILHPSTYRLQVRYDHTGPPAYRVAATGPRVGFFRKGPQGRAGGISLGGGAKPLKDVWVCEMNPPDPQGRLISPVHQVHPITMLANIMRLCYARAAQLNAAGIAFTELVNMPEQQQMPDVANFGAHVQVREGVDQERYDRVARVAALQQVDGLGNAEFHQPPAGLSTTDHDEPTAWTMVSDINGMVVPALARYADNLRPIHVAVAPGRRMVAGPNVTSPPNYADVLREEQVAIAAATSVPTASTLNPDGGRTTTVADAASVQAMDNAVQRYAAAIGPVVEFALDQVLGTSSVLQNLREGRTKPATLAEAEKEAAAPQFKVVFHRAIDLGVADHLWEAGLLKPSVYRDYVARLLRIPAQDLRAPPELDREEEGAGPPKKKPRAGAV